jgi:hypothetical protein
MKTRWQIEDERDKRAQEEWRARQERLATSKPPSSTLIDARYEATLAVDFEDDGDSDRETK